MPVVVNDGDSSEYDFSGTDCPRDESSDDGLELVGVASSSDEGVADVKEEDCDIAASDIKPPRQRTEWRRVPQVTKPDDDLCAMFSDPGIPRALGQVGVTTPEDLAVFAMNPRVTSVDLADLFLNGFTGGHASTMTMLKIKKAAATAIVDTELWGQMDAEEACEWMELTWKQTRTAAAAHRKVAVISTAHQTRRSQPSAEL